VGGVTDGRHDFPGGLGRRYIQGNNQALARVHLTPVAECIGFI
jgi:hypothetical protein